MSLRGRPAVSTFGPAGTCPCEDRCVPSKNSPEETLLVDSFNAHLNPRLSEFETECTIAALPA